jgi:hypothetical protein
MLSEVEKSMKESKAKGEESFQREEFFLKKVKRKEHVR